MSEIRKRIDERAEAALAMTRRHDWEEAHPGKPYPHADKRSYGWDDFAAHGQIIGWGAVRLTLASRERGLALLDWVLSNTTKAGFTIYDEASSVRLTLSRGGEALVWLQLREKVKCVFTKSTNPREFSYRTHTRVYQPTGTLSFLLTQLGGATSELKEAPGVTFDDLVKRVCQAIERRYVGAQDYVREAAARKASEEAEQRVAAARAEADRALAEIERLREAGKTRAVVRERRRQRELLLDASSWQRAEAIGMYLAELDRRVAGGAHPVDGYDEWRKWAEETAEALAASAFKARLRDKH